jgi:hypothetical protein
MSNKLKQFKDDLIDGWLKWLIAAIILFFTTQGEKIYNKFDTGIKIQEEIAFEHKVDSLAGVKLMKMSKSNEFMMGIMNSPWMIDYKRKERDDLIKRSLHKDSTKVKMSASLVLKTGMNKEAMEDTIASMINIHNSRNYSRNRHNVMPH